MVYSGTTPVKFTIQKTYRTTGADTLLLYSYCSTSLSGKDGEVYKDLSDMSFMGVGSPMYKAAEIFFKYGGSIVARNLWAGGTTAIAEASYTVPADRIIQLPHTEISALVVKNGATTLTADAQYIANAQLGTVYLLPNVSTTALLISYSKPNYGVMATLPQPNTEANVDSIYIDQSQGAISDADFTSLLGYAADLRAFLFWGLPSPFTVGDRFDSSNRGSTRNQALVLIYPLLATGGNINENLPLNVIGALSERKYATPTNNKLEGLVLKDVRVGGYDKTGLSNYGVTVIDSPLGFETKTRGNYVSSFRGDYNDPLRFYSAVDTKNRITDHVAKVQYNYSGLEFSESYITLISSELFKCRSLPGVNPKSVKVFFEREKMLVVNGKVTLEYTITYQNTLVPETVIYNVILEV